MAVHYREGETKKRPGIYQRQSNVGFDTLAGAQDGYCAIPVRSSWGPLGKVVRNTLASDLIKNYGNGEYSEAYTVPAASALFEGGASVVYTYRLGTGGTAASKELTSGLTATAMYPGTMPISVAVQTKLGDTSHKVLQVYRDTTLVESFEFAADGTGEGAALIDAAANSSYIKLTADGTAPATVPILAAASGAMEGGADPTVTNSDYSAAFAAFEPYYYNTIALDVDDDEDMTLSLMLQAYLDNANPLGKLGMAVVGQKVDVDFTKRCTNARAFNDEKAVFLGGGYMAGSTSKDGVMAICYTAGVIAATPSNQGITHTVINGATDVCESLTFAQYEDAIDAGMLMLSLSPDGNVWYDSGINTLTAPETGTQDEGWKKIRRVKVRYELFDRIDRELAPKVGKVSANSDGVADIVQAGQRVLDAMVTEGKIMAGATFAEDPANPYNGDSAWFIIQADDVDSLEKIYLHYQFRYSQNA